MRTSVLNFDSQKNLNKQLEALGSHHPHFIIAFLPPESSLQTQLNIIKGCLPNTLLVGATACHQFVNGKLYDSGCLHLFWFDNANHQAWVKVIECDEQGQLHTEKAIQYLEDKQPDAILLLVDGVRFPVHALLNTLRHCCVDKTPHIVGALAAKELNPEHYFDNDGGWTFVDQHIYSNAALLIGLNGIDIDVHILRGWEPASPMYNVTQAKNNVLFSVDDIPAADWYRDFFALEGQTPKLPEDSYSFPLIMDSSDPARKAIYRTMMIFDDPPGSVTLAGDIHTGDKIQLGLGDDRSLISDIEQLDLKDADACLLFSCAVREMILSNSEETEIVTLRKKLGDMPFSGFSTFGEIGPSHAGGLSFYNQTAILTLLTEKS